MAKALYRKYRPSRLEDVVGQEQVTKLLSESLKQQNISHAYLFVGPRGTGKTSVARIFAHEINNFKYEIEDNYIDIIEIDGASNRGVDDIRELREKAVIAPTIGKYKIYIIDEVHMLTREAFNALLKTLEEPPAHVIFIMATTELNKVPITITSRAQVYNFKLAEHDVMLNFLKNVAKKERLAISDEALNIITKRGGGSFRDSLSLLDQLSSISREKITENDVISALGLPKGEKIINLINNYANNNTTEIINNIKDLLSSNVKPEIVAEELINYILENPKKELFNLLEELPKVQSPFAEAKLVVALCKQDEISRPSVKIAQNQKDTSLPRVRDNNKKQLSGINFDRSDFLEKARNISDVIYLQLKKSELEYENGVLNVFPNTKISETILNAKNNQKVLSDLADGFNIKVKSLDDKPKSAKNDDFLDKISDIMGGKVKKDGGENPF